MDATGVKSPVVGFEKICKNAELVSKLSLAGHISGNAYVTALRNSISADTGVDTAVWTIGGQFELNTRGSESLPTGLLAPSKRILSRTSASQFFQETAHILVYETFAGSIADYKPVFQNAAASPEIVTPMMQRP
jgi:hypothetical protein